MPSSDQFSLTLVMGGGVDPPQAAREAATSTGRTEWMKRMGFKIRPRGTWRESRGHFGTIGRLRSAPRPRTMGERATHDASSLFREAEIDNEGH